MRRVIETPDAVVQWDDDRIEVTPRMRRGWWFEGAALAFAIAIGCLLAGNHAVAGLGIRAWLLGALLLLGGQIARIPRARRVVIERGDTYRSVSVALRIDEAEVGRVQRVEVLSAPPRRRDPRPSSKRVAVIVDERVVDVLPWLPPSDAEAIADALAAMVGVPVTAREDYVRRRAWALLVILLHVFASVVPLFVMVAVLPPGPGRIALATVAGTACSVGSAWLAGRLLVPFFAPRG